MIEPSLHSVVPGGPSGIRICPLAEVDAAEMYASIAESRAEVRPWMPDLAQVSGVDDVRGWMLEAAEWWKAGDAYNFAIVDAAGRCLGGCGLTQINRRHRFGNVYYWVRSSATRQGVASSSARLLAQFAFREVGLQRVEILMATGNAASRRAAEKAGARYEGTLRNRLSMHDLSYDAHLYSLIPEDVG